MAGMGGAQRLENGNTLITESDNGRAFEVTRAGEIVWDYYNTDVSKDGTSRNKIWRIHRVSAKELGALHWSDEARRSFAEAEFPLPQ